MLEYENQLNLSKYCTIKIRFSRLSGNNVKLLLARESDELKWLNLNSCLGENSHNALKRSSGGMCRSDRCEQAGLTGKYLVIRCVYLTKSACQGGLLEMQSLQVKSEFCQ